MIRTRSIPVMILALSLTVPASLAAQTPAETPWSADVSIGWDNSISGDFLRGAIGTLQGAPVVLDNQGWDEVYGTGVFFNIGVGYSLTPRSEVRGGFAYQSTGSEDAVTIGTYRGGPLAATFDNYNAWSLEGGYRQYFGDTAERWRPYAGASFGFGRVGDIQVDVAQTAANFAVNDADFYGSNASINFGFNGGVLYNLTSRFALDARLGLRYTSGLSNVDSAQFGDLDDANNGSSRWTLPLSVGVKVRF